MHNTSTMQADWYNRFMAAASAPRATGVLYAEASYFDGYHFAHIAARDEHKRLQRIEKRCAQVARERRVNRR